MSDSYFQIFKTPDDHFVWENHIEFIKQNTEMNSVLQSKLINAFLFFRKEFGNDLIKNQYYRNHPIVSAIQNKAPWSLQWLIKLHSSLKFYKEANSNYEKILPKLLSALYCTREGIPFVEIAESYRSAGCEIVFEPEVPSQKKPDLEITSLKTGEKIFAEISMLNEGDQRNHNGKLYYTLFDQFTLNSPWLPFCGKMFRSFSREELVVLCEEIHTQRKIALARESLVTYRSELVEFVVAHPNKISEVEAVAEEKKYRMNDILSLPIVFNEFERIRSNKLKEEAKQIPPGAIGIIYFIIDPTYLLGYNPTDDILNLKTKLKEFPNIAGIAIQSKMLDQSEEIDLHEDDVIYRRKIFWDCLRQDTIFIFNQSAASGISTTIFSKIVGSFK